MVTYSWHTKGSVPYQPSKKHKSLRNVGIIVISSATIVVIISPPDLPVISSFNTTGVHDVKMHASKYDYVLAIIVFVYFRMFYQEGNVWRLDKSQPAKGDSDLVIESAAFEKMPQHPSNFSPTRPLQTLLHKNPNLLRTAEKYDEDLSYPKAVFAAAEKGEIRDKHGEKMIPFTPNDTRFDATTLNRAALDYLYSARRALDWTEKDQLIRQDPLIVEIVNTAKHDLNKLIEASNDPNRKIFGSVELWYINTARDLLNRARFATTEDTKKLYHSRAHRAEKIFEVTLGEKYMANDEALAVLKGFNTASKAFRAASVYTRALPIICQTIRKDRHVMNTAGVTNTPVLLVYGWSTGPVLFVHLPVVEENKDKSKLWLDQSVTAQPSLANFINNLRVEGETDRDRPTGWIPSCPEIDKHNTELGACFPTLQNYKYIVPAFTWLDSVDTLIKQTSNAAFARATSGMMMWEGFETTAPSPWKKTQGNVMKLSPHVLNKIVNELSPVHMMYDTAFLHHLRIKLGRTPTLEQIVNAIYAHCVKHAAEEYVESNHIRKCQDAYANTKLAEYRSGGGEFLFQPFFSLQLDECNEKIANFAKIEANIEPANTSKPTKAENINMVKYATREWKRRVLSALPNQPTIQFTPSEYLYALEHASLNQPKEISINLEEILDMDFMHVYTQEDYDRHAVYIISRDESHLDRPATEQPPPGHSLPLDYYFAYLGQLFPRAMYINTTNTAQLWIELSRWTNICKTHPGNKIKAWFKGQPADYNTAAKTAKAVNQLIEYIEYGTAHQQKFAKFTVMCLVYHLAEQNGTGGTENPIGYVENLSIVRLDIEQLKKMNKALGTHSYVAPHLDFTSDMAKYGEHQEHLLKQYSARNIRTWAYEGLKAKLMISAERFRTYLPDSWILAFADLLGAPQTSERRHKMVQLDFALTKALRMGNLRKEQQEDMLKQAGFTLSYTRINY